MTNKLAEFCMFLMFLILALSLSTIVIYFVGLLADAL